MDKPPRKDNAAYMRWYYANNPEKKEHKNRKTRERLRDKRADPDFRIDEKVKNEIAKGKHQYHG